MQSFGHHVQFVGASLGGAGGASRDVESNYGGENSGGGPVVRLNIRALKRMSICGDQLHTSWMPGMFRQ